MKTNFIYLIVFSIFITISCSDMPDSPMEEDPQMEEEDPPMEDPPVEDKISIIYPTLSDEVHYCCFNFEWKDPNDEGEYRIQIAKYSSFENPILDTLVSGTSMEFPSFLNPRDSYFWRVIAQDSKESKISNFKIIDYASHLSGSYEATKKEYSWTLIEGIITDTVYQTYLYMTKGDDHSISYSNYGSSGVEDIPFSELFYEDYIVYRIKHSYPGNIDYVRYYFEADSLSIRSESGANGGGGYSTITAVRK